MINAISATIFIASIVISVWIMADTPYDDFHAIVPLAILIIITMPVPILIMYLDNFEPGTLMLLWIVSMSFASMAAVVAGGLI